MGEKQKRFKKLQTALDEMTAYYIKDTGRTPGSTSILELMKWVQKQTQKNGGKSK